MPSNQFCLYANFFRNVLTFSFDRHVLVCSLATSLRKINLTPTKAHIIYPPSHSVITSGWNFTLRIFFWRKKILFPTDENCRFELNDVIAFFISTAVRGKTRAENFIIIYNVKKIVDVIFISNTKIYILLRASRSWKKIFCFYKFYVNFISAAN